MIQYQVLENEINDLQWIHTLDKAYYNISIVSDWKDINPSIAAITKSNLLYPHVRHWLNINQPALYLGRGYVGNHVHKTRKLWSWRASMNGWANTQLKKIPYRRWPLTNLPRHPWKVKSVKNVLIAPSKMTAPIWEPNIGYEWANHIAQKFPGATIKIRYKPETPGIRWSTLWQDLDWADLVVSQSSAITCEALWYGKKVISTQPCPTWAAGNQSIDAWEDPTEPAHRDQWHEHIAWLQYSASEWNSGLALQLITRYLGSPITFTPEYSYNFQ